LNELALFAGAGGGILGGHLLGWRCVCAVEYNAYARSVLLARQNDGTLPPFPVWDDVRTFDGKPWGGIVDVVSGGFPCQDISAAGRGEGLDGERSGLWSEMARIICEVRPRFVFVENSPILTSRGLGRVLGDLAAMGFDAEWGVISAADTGAPHRRERIWIVANARSGRRDGEEVRQVEQSWGAEAISGGEALAYPNRREQSLRRLTPGMGRVGFTDKDARDGFTRRTDWPVEPGLGRVVDGMAHRVDRLKAIGNGQVSRVAATAFLELASRFE
jgi:DNA (cytosine-5)-methyltransferase 1